MKKYLKLNLLLFAFNFSSNAQNLVPNPGFENYISCPNSPTLINLATGWSAYGGSPDYFNSCAPSCVFPGTCLGIPDNFAGHQFPYNGNAYAGVATEAFPAGGNAHEFMGIQLIQPLVPGKKYFVSANICRGDGYGDRAATNNFGFRFSTIAYVAFTNSVPIDNFSQVHDTSIVTDSINWTRIAGSFIPDSAYQFLSIGNFYDDQHTDTIDTAPYIISLSVAYYLVDDVCVTDDSLNCNVINDVNSVLITNEFNLFPNPFIDQLNISVSENEPMEIVIYDVFSRKILEQHFINSTSIDTKLFTNGIYYYELLNNNYLEKSGIIIHD